MENNIIYDKEQLEQMGVTRGETAGKINMMGINIDLSKTMGDMLAEQYIAQLSPEDMQRLMDFISNDLFTKQSRYDYTEGISKEIKVIASKDIPGLDLSRCGVQGSPTSVERSNRNWS